MLYKVSATGNDFLVFDTIHEAPFAGARPGAVRRVCDRHEGIGADGGVFLEAREGVDFAWDFYNSDGSAAEMCGNAARAVSLYWFTRTGRRDIRFATATGVVEARIVSPDHVEVELRPVAESAWSQWSQSGLSYHFVRAGVPHVVVNVPDLQDRERLRALALELKREPKFVAAGTNVTFVHAVDASRIDSVTFERGVEDFTLACGTGAVAAAHSVLRGEEGRRLEVRVPGGRLFVIWKNGRPVLEGPARVIAKLDWLLGGE